MKNYYVALIASLLTMSSVFALAKDVIPDGWSKVGSNPSDYSVGVDYENAFAGAKSVFLESKPAGSKGYVALGQMNDIENYRGKRVQLTIHIKTQNVDGWAGGWFRIDRDQTTSMVFDNMENRAIKGSTEWTKYTLVLDVPKEGINMAYGLILQGNGKVWFDNLSFDVVDKNTPVTDLYAANKNGKRAKNLSFEND